MQFNAHVICDVETRILAEDKDISQPQTEVVVGFQTEQDLEDKRMRRASVLSLFSLSLFSSIQVWVSEREREREK